MGQPGPGRQQRIAALQSAAQRDLEQIRRILEDITGFNSLWSGNVTVEPLSVDYLGVKQWSCDIGIREDVLQHREQRWTTMIHESLHPVSNGLQRDSYSANQGWEEGIVEQAQRILRNRIFDRLNISARTSQLRDIDRRNLYNDFVSELETLRTRLGIESERFYLELLSAPLAERSQFVKTIGDNRWVGDALDEWHQVFEQSDKVLRRVL